MSCLLLPTRPSIGRPGDGGRCNRGLGRFGTTTLFDAATLASLYPSHRVYVARFDKATRNAVGAGVLLKADAKLLKRWAHGSNVGR